jgi:hypothetical protein
MNEYGLAAVAAIGVTIAFVVATNVIRGVVGAIVALLWPGGRFDGPPNSAGGRPKGW